MKKYFYLLAVFLFVLAVPRFASAADQVRDQIRLQSPSGSPLGTGVKNQNRIQTENQGEDNLIQTQNQEDENETAENDNKPNSRSETAREHMSTVAQKVEELLANRTTGGGIGDQISAFAQAQKEAQDETGMQVDKLSSRGNIYHFFFGPDYKTMKEINAIMEQNRLRITQMEQLMNQVANAGDKTMLQETIEALTQLNTSLQDMVSEEGKVFGLFGWLSKLLAK